MQKCDILLATNNTKLVRNFRQTLPRLNMRLDAITVPTQLNRIFRKKGRLLEVLILDLNFPADEINRFIFYIKQYRKDMPVLLLHINRPLIQEREVFRNLSVYGCIRKPSNKIEAERILKDLNSILDLDMDKKLAKVDYLEKEKVFACTFKNGRTYFLPRKDLPEDDNSKIKNYVIDKDEYYFTVYLESGREYIVLWDFILSICEERYEFHRNKDIERISPKEIGERIKKMRVLKKLTQEDLEAKTGILRANIARIENGAHYPSLETLEKIAEGLEVPVANFLVKRIT